MKTHVFRFPSALVAAILISGCAPEPTMIDLTEAIRNEDVEAVKILLSADINLEPPCGPNQICKPLAFAASRGNLDIVKLLIDAGADPNGKNAYADTAFIVAENAAAVANKSPEDIRAMRAYLIEHGTDVNQPNAFGISPFMGVAAAGDIALMELALAHGADVNAVFERTVESSDPSRHSALMWAALGGKEEAVTLLLERGADPAYTNSAGETARDWAERQRHAGVVAILDAAAEPDEQGAQEQRQATSPPVMPQG